MESVKKKYHDASEKVAEKYRQYQKLQVSIPAPLKLNTQSLHYIQIKDFYKITIDTELSITAFVHVIIWNQTNKLHVDRNVSLGKRFVLKMKLTGHSVVEKKYIIDKLRQSLY